MRSSGAVDSAKGLGLNDHLCWVYEEHDEFRADAIDFLADGLFIGQRIGYVGSSSIDDLTADLGDLGDVEELIGRSALRVASLSDTYGSGAVVEARRLVAAYASETDAALGQGFTGLRVAVEVTRLVETQDQRDAFTVYETLIDAYITAHPFSAMCAYNIGKLAVDSVAELASLHPIVRSGSAPFQIFQTGDGSMVLRGEIDINCWQLFARALERTLSQAGPTVLIDATRLEFIDHRGLLSLEEHLQLSGKRAVLRTRQLAVLSVAELLDLAAVRVEVAE